MENHNSWSAEDPSSPTFGPPERLSWWQKLVLYSQYIIIAVLAVIAVALQLRYGHP